MYHPHSRWFEEAPNKGAGRAVNHLRQYPSSITSHGFGFAILTFGFSSLAGLRRPGREEKSYPVLRQFPITAEPL